MVKLILKSPYIKSSGGAGGYLKYIATRERVEIIPDDRPPTRKQEQLIAKLTKDFPDSKTLYEYEDYSAKPTKANASAFITLALESNWENVNRSDQYAKYIATRPRAERVGSHGLFGDEDGVDLDKAMSELESYTGNVWTHIISLHREDAQRLGYDNAQAWRDLIRAHRNDIAAAMNIPPSDFRWYAAFHDEGDHPHIHMMAWSAKPGQAYLNKDGIRQIRSKLTNQIFRHEMLHLYEQKTVARDELVRQARDTMKQLSRQMQKSICDHPEVEQLMQDLSRQLQSVSGKKSYAYIPKSVKKTVDEIVDRMEQLPIINKCYEQWWQLQCELEESYAQKKRARPKLSELKEFRAIKNAVIREANHIRLGAVTFEEPRLKQQDEPDEDDSASYTYWELKDVIQDDDYSLEDRDHAAAQMERLADKGDRYAQHFMGKLYRDGGLLIPDTDKAVRYFESAAKQGLSAAQYALGKLYLDDEAVRDPKRGIAWLEHAAGNDNSYAAYRLGKEYLRGKAVRRDAAKAVSCFTKAAELGNQWGQYMLGKLYLTGQEFQYDKTAAIYWLTQAADQGNAYAEFFLERLNDLKPPSVMLSVSRLLHHMGRIFQEESFPKTGPAGIQIDRKRLEQLQEKRAAHGLKGNVYEEYRGPTMGGMSM
ncbi:MobP3 family relaxase [Intestinimonas butyriciproducens]|uniref:MobP3 family relaxase n=1 Tax=Intestinimonas butyriciproducens TaxID=1297617 RepID=UPI003AF1472F